MVGGMTARAHCKQEYEDPASVKILRSFQRPTLTVRFHLNLAMQQPVGHVICNDRRLFQLRDWAQTFTIVRWRHGLPSRLLQLARYRETAVVVDRS